MSLRSVRALTSNIVADVRYGARSLSSRPGFATVVVLTLALGIGVNVALFSLFEQVLLRPLPVAEPDRLVNLSDPGPKLDPSTGRGWFAPSVSGGPDTAFSYPMFRDLEREQQPFVGIAAHHLFDASLTSGAQAGLDTAIAVSGSYFSLLGLQPALGRLIGADDDRVPQQAESVVLSHAYWQREFAGDSQVLGRTLTVNGAPLTIVGVAPAGFHGTTVGARPSVFVPITFRLDPPQVGEQGAGSEHHANRGAHWVRLFARLAPGIGRGEASAAINALYRGIVDDSEGPLHEQGSEALRAKVLVLEPGAHGQSALVAPVRDQLAMLFALSGVVLLLCCANVAGLTLVRGSARTGEMAVRVSMGATRARLVSLLAVESLLLAVPAVVLSLPVASLTLRALASDVPGLLPATFDADLSVGAALVAIAVATVSALAFGLLPARDLLRADPARTLQAYGARQTSGKHVTRFRTALATAQIALSMALLALTGVCAHSLANIARIDLGLEVDSIVTFSMSPATSGYAPDAAARLVDRLQEELAGLPGVTSAAWSGTALLSGGEPQMMVRGVDGVVMEELMPLNSVSPGFFQTLGIAMLAGRDFAPADRAAASTVVVVNQRFVERFGLDAPIGTQVRPNPRVAWEIVGVVADAKYGNVTGEIQPQLFVAQSPFRAPSTTFYVRGARDPEGLLTAARDTVKRVDPIVPITGLRTMQQQVRENLAVERFIATASAGFGVLATVLAALGLYGVLAYSVVQRSREIGLRFALGAPAARIRRMVLEQVAAMAMAGLVLGAVAAWLLGRAAQSVLFGVEAADPLALTTAAAVLAAVMVAAAYFPARRASRIDPIEALRHE
jgi:putative ABC transport system permease protein